MCSLFSQRSTEKAIAIDGTPCLSSGVCVDGTCVVRNFKLAIYIFFITYCISLLDVMASLDQKE